MISNAAKNPSYIYKKQSAVNLAARTDYRPVNLAARENHEDRLRELLATPGLNGKRVEIAVSLLPDPSLNPAEKLVLIAVTVIAEMRGGDCNEALEVIAGFANVSPRTARRAVRTLCNQRRLHLFRNPNRRYPDTLSIPSLPQRAEAKSATRGPHLKCRCGVYRAITVAGICGYCVAGERAEKEVGAVLQRMGDVARTVAWAELKASGSKCSAKDIQRAYLKLTGRAD